MVRELPNIASREQIAALWMAVGLGLSHCLPAAANAAEQTPEQHVGAPEGESDLPAPAERATTSAQVGLGKPSIASRPQPRWDFFFRSHHIGASNWLSGPGARVPGLATTHDMSLFEWNWGGRQRRFNGSGVTLNSNFPVTEGAALTTSSHIGFTWDGGKSHSAGFELELYNRLGDETVGRVFGEELPFSGFTRSSGVLAPPQSSLRVYNGWFETSGRWGAAQATFGTLHPDRLPEIGRRELNFMRLGSLIYRPPITHASFFEKEDRKIETGRHPLFGADLLGDVNLGGERKLHYELLAGRAKPTPVSPVERDVVGGRLSAPIRRLNLGLSYFRTEGSRKPQIEAESQDLAAIDFSLPLGFAALYGALAQSSYRRDADLRGTARVLGLRRALGENGWVRAQYQGVGENYDLMGHHKVEHYPSNFGGLNVEGTYPVGTAQLNLMAYWLWQRKPGDMDRDVIWGDSFFPDRPRAPKGEIQVFRLAGRVPLRRDRAALLAYVERADFRKPGPRDGRIAKRVTNGYLFLTHRLHPRLELELGYRIVTADGRWEKMSFDHAQSLPELGVVWNAPGRQRVRVIYHAYHFSDGVRAARGRNDWRGNQLLLDVLFSF